ncbi:MAG TPA: tryptophan 2,3-dioxygenase family protein [Longimicrobiales bacterium]
MAFGIPDPKEPKLTYGSYLGIDELTNLQNLKSDPARHDELLFIIIHQVYELWFKQLLHELDAIVVELQENDTLGASRLLRRCIEIERVLIQQVLVLETMTPNDFLTFRDHLMPASGFQSVQFRSLEAVCGVRNPAALKQFAEGTPARAALEKRLNAPTIIQAFYDVLRKRGFDLPEGDDDVTHERRVRQLVQLYLKPDERYDLYMLAESLVEFDELFTLWRVHHVQMVERMIGSKPGTGGSAGVAYLKTTLDRKFFPELWELRTYLSDISY